MFFLVNIHSKIREKVLSCSYPQGATRAPRLYPSGRRYQSKISAKISPLSTTLWITFRFVLPRFCLGAKGAILVFDLTRMASFYSLPEWVALIRGNSGQIPIILVGNKYDLAQQMNIQSPTSELENFQKRFEINEYIETSAKDGNNIERAFQILLENIKNKKNSSR